MWHIGDDYVSDAHSEVKADEAISSGDGELVYFGVDIKAHPFDT